MYANTHAAIAEDMYMTMSQLRGFWVKLGQYISTRADMVRMFTFAASSNRVLTDDRIISSGITSIHQEVQGISR